MRLAEGLHPGVEEAVYRSHPGINISTLKYMAKSPLAYKHAKDHPSIQTPAMALGSAAHCAILEPARFIERYAVFGGARRQGKEWEAFQAENADKEIIKQEEWSRCQAMAVAVHRSEAAQRYLKAGQPEVSMLWNLDGVACKGRIDWLTDHVIVDLKTTTNCSAAAFGRQFANLHYASQMAFYLGGYKKLTDVMPKVVCIAVESSAPHEVAVYSVGDDIIQRGEAEYMSWLQTLEQCEKAGVWPPALTGETPLVLPRWAYMDDEDGGLELDFGGVA